MLLETVHLPHLYCTRDELTESGLFYGACLSLLSKMCVNCVILVDENGAVLSSIGAHIDAWPPKYRKRAQEVLVQLKNRRRFVRPLAGTPHAADEGGPCAAAKRIALESVPEAVLGPDECLCGSACFPQGLPAWIPLGQYELSDFEMRRQDLQTGKLLGDGEMSRAVFESQVLKPILKHSRKMQIVDRQFGRSLVKGLEKHPPNGHVNLADVPENYLRGLQFLLAVFSQVSRPPACFELVTELTSWRSKSRAFVKPDEVTRTRAEKTLRFLGKELQKGYGVEVDMDIRFPGRGLRVPHDRFLVTDQAILQIGSGIDLLRPDGKVRGITLSLVGRVPWGRDSHDGGEQ